MRRCRRLARATLWALAGALLLGAGCFAPIAAGPASAVTLIGAGSIPARLILVAALSSVALLLFRRRRALLVSGVFAGLMVIVEFLAYQDRLAVISGAGPSAGALLASGASEWGWALLVCGVALLLLAGLVPDRRHRTRSGMRRGPGSRDRGR